MRLTSAPVRAPLGVAVVGLGFGQVHVAAFRRDARCQVVALCGRQSEKLTELTTKLAVPGGEVQWQRLMERDDIQIISLAVPAPQQEEIGRAALSAGKHVFFEKPLATTLASAEQLAELAVENRCVTAVNFEFAEIPVWQDAKRLLESGRLGELRHVTVTWRVETYANRMRFDNWKARASEGGGALNLFSSHCFYYLEWLLGPMRTVYADLARAPGDPRAGDTLNTLLLTTAAGLRVAVTIATDAFCGSGHRVELVGDAGTLVLENRGADYVSGFRMFLAERERPELRELTSGDLRGAPDEDGRIGATAAIARRFVDAIISSDNAATPGIYEGRRVQALMDAAKRSAQQGAVVELPPRHEPRSE